MFSDDRDKKPKINKENVPTSHIHLEMLKKKTFIESNDISY